MVVLVVDDQISVVSGILFGVDWKRVGVERALKAYNAREARAVLQSQQVDILLCDIEMPGESGLDLFRWMRENGQNAECIFLTAHADFMYVREAMQLGGFDYILQPARYEEIENAILRAGRKLQTKAEMEEYYHYGRMLCRKKDSFLDTLLADWLNGRAIDWEPIARDMRELGISLRAGAELRLGLLEAFRWGGDWQESEDALQRYALANLLTELFGDCGQNVLLAQLEHGLWAFLVYSETGGPLEKQAYLRQLNRLLEVCRDSLSCFAACYTGDPFLPPEMAEQAETLFELKNNNVAKLERVFYNGDAPARSASCELPNMHLWGNLLLQGCAASMRTEAYAWFQEKAAAGALNAELLQRFYQEYFQMLSAVAEQGGGSVTALFGDKEMLEKALHSYGSVEDMKELIDYTAAYFSQNEVEQRDSKSQVEQIVRYVMENLDRDIRRTDVAEVVFLNPNYVSRLFKSETGLSLKEFIVQEKMKLARRLLRTTKLPVSMVGVKVGYTNFSHFSQVYKKVFGVNPAEDRREPAAPPS